jgi:hypothetical protein
MYDPIEQVTEKIIEIIDWQKKKDTV